MARQAQSKEKVLAKMVEGGLTEKVGSDKVNDIPLLMYNMLPALGVVISIP